MIHKLKPALYSTLILSGILAAAVLLDGGFLLAFIVLAYAAFGNFIYGISVSMLSDRVTRKMKRWRFITAAGIHIAFGFLTVIVIQGLAFFAVISAVLFFAVDEWQKSKREGPSGISKRVLAMQGVIISAFTALAIFGLYAFLDESQEKTNNIFLFPEGFEGAAIVFYNIPGEPALEKDGEYSVIPVNVESLPTLEGTNMEKYGIYQTASPQLGYGEVNDKYFYVDEEGNRTEIDEYCVHLGVSGSYTNSEDRDIPFSTLQVTNTQCGEDFFLDGSELYYIQSREIENYWIGY